MGTLGRRVHVGQDVIPDIEAPGCTWGRYVEQLCLAHGGPTALVDLLIRRAGTSVDLPSDPQTIERAIRRLGAKGNGDGGKYGRWLIRFFGVPPPLVETARWMGQYHSRFSDLPSSLRHAQLLLWDRPPICETSAAVWIHLGLASVAMRRERLDEAQSRLQRARPKDADAELETRLLEARLASDRDDDEAVETALSAAEDRLAEVEDPGYAARLADQRAYRLLRGSTPRLEEARGLYASIEATTPFAAFRRSHGLAYCAWKLGDHERARTEAHAAADHAADGGLVRFRAQALALLAHIVGGEQGERLRARARSMALVLEQEDLLQVT